MSTATRTKTLAGVRLVAFDVDGVFTDGRFYLSNDGIESKAFSTQDGYGIRRLIDAGLSVAVISGRKSQAVEQRMQELGVRFVVQGCKDKIAAFDAITSELQITDREYAFVGDVLPDMPLLEAVGFSVAVRNAVGKLHDRCDHVTAAPGGNGAVRDVCDLVLDARNQGLT